VTAAARCGRICQGRWTLSAASATVTKPSNSTPCNRNPSPPRLPPFSVHMGSLAGSVFKRTLNVALPCAGTVMLVGALTFTLPAESVIRFGSDRGNAEHLGYGTTLDDVRLYSGVCYTGDVLTQAESTICPTPLFYENFDGPPQFRVP